MEDITTAGIVAGLVTTIIGFFVGKTGVLTRIFDSRIKNIEGKQVKELSMIDAAIAENKDLREEVQMLQRRVSELESDVKEYQRSMQLILVYLKKLDIQDPFIDQIIK